jgi:hypothetical protein
MSYFTHSGKHQQLYDTHVNRLPRSTHVAPKSAHEELLRYASTIYHVAYLNRNYTWANLIDYGLIPATYKAPAGTAKSVQTFFKDHPQLTPARLERLMDNVLLYVNSKATTVGGVFNLGSAIVEIASIDLTNLPSKAFIEKDRESLTVITGHEHTRRVTRRNPLPAINLNGAGQLKVYKLPRTQMVADAVQKMDPELWQAISKAYFVCKKGINAGFLTQTFNANEYLIVVYGNMASPEKRIPLGFAMVSMIKGTYLATKYPVKKGIQLEVSKTLDVDGFNTLYLDLVCAPFSVASVGTVILNALQSPEIRRVISRRAEIARPYNTIALRAISKVYTYYPMKQGFVRSNGNRKVYPLGQVDNLTFYEGKDVPIHMASLIKPLAIFEGDSNDNGYLYVKQLPELDMDESMAS